MDMTAAQLEFLAGPRAAELLVMDLPADELHALGLLRRSCSPEESRAIMALRALRQRPAAAGRIDIAAETQRLRGKRKRSWVAAHRNHVERIWNPCLPFLF